MSEFPHKDRISIVIPAKDEELSITEIITACHAFSNDIIVADGHSVDSTREKSEIAGATVILDGRKGKGEAMRCVIPFIRNEITVFIDADGSHDPQDIAELVQPIIDGSADHVTGSRLIGGSSELHGGFDECLRLMGSSFITACINKRFNVRLSDSQNGFRAIRTECLKALDLKENITTIEQEMIMKTLKKGFRMAEVPAHEHKRKHGTSHIHLERVWWKYGLGLVKHLLFP